MSQQDPNHPRGEDSPRASHGASLTDGERQFLLRLARECLVSAAQGDPRPAAPLQDLSPRLTRDCACFVTLTKGGALRGCIGDLLPHESLCEAVISNTRAAALRDPRFEPVQPDEVDLIRIEISVLSVPVPLSFQSPEDLLAQVRPHVDGVVLEIGGRRATFLPQVWEQIPGRVEFFEQLCRKAGQPAWAWRQKGVSVSTYQVEAFEEQ